MELGMKQEGRKSDIPLPLAIVIGAAAMMIVFLGGRFDDMQVVLSKLEQIFKNYEVLITISTFSIVFNFFVAWIAIASVITWKAQGKRLRDLTGEKESSGRKLRKYADGIWKPIFVWSFASFAVFCIYYRQEMGNGVPSDLFLFIAMNLGITASIIFRFVSLGLKRHQEKKSIEVLEPSRIEPNTLAVGTTLGHLEKEEWVYLNQQALNGNILVTGSIGSGKTQGTILPYFDNLMRSLTAMPTVLAIDPKGTFIRDAVKIACQHGVEGKIRHMTLNGETSYNPIYAEKILKHGKFVSTAQMIRAAAINFSGRSSESAFWELGAFNLTKNALVYVAAVHGYFTLNDLYIAMCDATEDRLAEKLEDCLRREEFDDEEKANIRHALAYFSQEFKNLDQKIKTGIHATATSFLNQFQEYRVGKIFCPPKDARSIESMDLAVDNALMLFFDINIPGLSRAMGTLVKLLFLLRHGRQDESDEQYRDRPVNHPILACHATIRRY